MQMHPWNAALCAASLTVSTAATANEGLAEGSATLEVAQPRSISLDFSAPESCPNGDTFAELLETRLPGFTVSQFRALSEEESQSDETHSNEETKQNVLIEVVGRPGSFEGTFSGGAAGQSHGRRMITSPNCGDLLEALSVVVAIAIDPDSDANQEATAISSAAIEPASEAGPSPKAEVTRREAKDTAVDQEATARRPSHFRHPMDVNRRIPVEKGVLAVDNRFVFGLQSGGTFGMVRGAALTQTELSARWELFLEPPSGEDFQIGVMPRLRLGFWDSIAHKPSEFRSNLSGSFVAFGLCATPYFNPAGLSLLLCADYGPGSLEMDSPITTIAPSKGLRTFSLSLEAEYHLFWKFHFSVKAGMQLSQFNDHTRTLESNHAAAVTLRPGAFVISAGLGARF